MAESTFDAAYAVQFEPSRGSIVAADGAQMVLVASSVLDEFVRAAAPQGVVAFGRALGGAMGQRISARVGGGDKVNAASAETVIDHLAGELAIAGLGVLSIERWGHALVFVLDGTCISNDVFLSSALEGALEKASARDVSCTVLAREKGRVHIFAGAKATTIRIRGWLVEGSTWRDALRKLQTKATPS